MQPACRVRRAGDRPAGAYNSLPRRPVGPIHGRRPHPTVPEPRMEYVNLGRTGVKVSRLCLGCMTYGSSKWRPWVLDEDASRPFFRKAWEAGVNFFDTADMY